MVMKNLKESQQVLKYGPSSKKRSQRNSNDSFSFLRKKFEYDKEFREKGLKLKKRKKEQSFEMR